MKKVAIIAIVVAIAGLSLSLMLLSKVCNTPQVDGGKHKLCINITHKNKGPL